MNIRIRGIRDAGDATRERLVLEAAASLDIGRYLVARTKRIGNGQVSNELREVFWFPDKQVKPADLIILYTKSGTAKEKKTTSDSTSHFFYWGLENALWETTSAAVLIRAAEWGLAEPVSEET